MRILHKIAAIACLLINTGVFSNAQEYPFRNKNLSSEARVNDLIAHMTLDEKIDMLESDFFYRGCERLGLPPFETTDGPLGIASWGLKGGPRLSPVSCHWQLHGTEAWPNTSVPSTRRSVGLAAFTSSMVQVSISTARRRTPATLNTWAKTLT